MHFRLPFRLPFLLVTVLLCLTPGTALPSDPKLNLELNDASTVGQSCRVSFLVQNKLGSLIEALKLELVLFDVDGQVNRLLSVNFGRLPLNKSRLKQFDLKGLSCSQIGRLLVNNVTECQGQGRNLTPAFCTDAIKTSSRIAITLNY
ncbi:MAG: hypothetical protein AAFR90_12240 [Pseudomonadota bacterium]